MCLPVHVGKWNMIISNYDYDYDYNIYFLIVIVIDNLCRYSFYTRFSGASQFNSYYLTYYSIAIFVCLSIPITAIMKMMITSSYLSSD